MRQYAYLFSWLSLGGLTGVLCVLLLYRWRPAGAQARCWISAAVLVGVYLGWTATVFIIGFATIYWLLATTMAWQRVRESWSLVCAIVAYAYVVLERFVSPLVAGPGPRIGLWIVIIGVVLAAAIQPRHLGSRQK